MMKNLGFRSGNTDNSNKTGYNRLIIFPPLENTLEHY